MNKKTLSVLAFLLIGVLARAQSGNKTSISFGAEFAIPLNTISDYGSVRDAYKDGVGGSVKVELPISSTMHFTGSAGYVYYPNQMRLLYLPTPEPIGTGASAVPPPFKFIPVKAGLQYYYDKYFYISGEAGAAFGANYASITSFIYSGGLGAVIPFNLHSRLDIGARYERGYEATYYDSPMSQVGFRLAYKYQF